MNRLRLLLYLLLMAGVWLLWKSRRDGGIRKHWRRELRRLGQVLIATLVLYWIVLLTVTFRNKSASTSSPVTTTRETP